MFKIVQIRQRTWFMYCPQGERGWRWWWRWKEREGEGGMKIITGRGPRRCFATMSDRIHQEFASEIWLALCVSPPKGNKMFSLLVSDPVYCNQGGGTNGVKKCHRSRSSVDGTCIGKRNQRLPAVGRFALKSFQRWRECLDGSHLFKGAWRRLT